MSEANCQDQHYIEIFTDNCKNKNIVQVSNNSNFFEHTIFADEDAKKVFINFVGNCFWLINDVVVTVDGKFVNYVCNSAVNDSDIIILNSKESELAVNVEKNSICKISVSFKYQYVDLDNDTLIVDLVKSYILDNSKIKRLISHQDTLLKDYETFANLYNGISNSIYWRITSPLRRFNTSLKRLLTKNRVLKLIGIYLKNLLLHGNSYAYKKVKKYYKIASKKVDYKISSKVREYQESYEFPKNIKFSVLVPLYNTPANFLREMIDSVMNQTYKNWELCLTDGSDNEHLQVGEICGEYSKKDSRIKYKKLEKNEGISENTNECIKMASGDYIALFDHDDILHPSALFENMKVICENDADYIYTDEATFDGSVGPQKLITLHYKPDFAYDNLLANNYICHFSVFKASLLQQVGMFRTKYDGSQDHDMILRLTTASKTICHIPQILYFWRSHKNSVAMDINSKQYAIASGRHLVHDYLMDKGYNTRVESSPAFPTIYRINYKITGNPKISIIITLKNRLSYIKQCINSITSISLYTNYEIILLDTGSTDPLIHDYYKDISQLDFVKIINYEEKYNYAVANNYAAKYATGDYLLFLNSDTEIISPKWIEELLMYSQREDVGAVGAKLYYDDDTVQHGGIILKLGENGIAGFSHQNVPKSNFGYMGKMFYAQDVTAVTSACLMIKKSLFDELGGFCTDYDYAFSDIDLCLRLREMDKFNIFNPFCELIHFTKKNKVLTQKDTDNINHDIEIFKSKWKNELEAGDRYYNVNFSFEESYYL